MFSNQIARAFGLSSSVANSTNEHEFPTTKSQLTRLRSIHGEPYRAVPASHPLQQAREESDARTCVYHSDREDTPLALLVGSGEM